MQGSGEKADAVTPARDSLSWHGVEAMHARRYGLAAKYFRAAVMAPPSILPARKRADTFNNLGLAYWNGDRVDLAAAAYRNALGFAPDHVEARFGLARCALYRGDFTLGWKLYAARLEYPDNAIAQRAFHAPPHAGRPLPGRSLLAWADQGLGDQIMFCSMLPELIATGAILTVEVDPRLRPLLRTSFPGLRTTSFVPHIGESCAGPHDAHTDLAGCAAWLRPDFHSFPRRQAYLRAHPALADHHRRAYRRHAGDLNRPIVGLSWQSTGPTSFATEKSIPAPMWGGVLRTSNCAWVNLQYGDAQPFIAAAQERTGARVLHDPGTDLFDDLEDLAGRVAACDLVITSSSTTAHLAGALGVPVWTLAARGAGAMWHWFDGSADSPWYPSMRVFRQMAAGEWSQPMAAAAAALQEFVEGWGKR